MSEKTYSVSFTAEELTLLVDTLFTSSVESQVGLPDNAPRSNEYKTWEKALKVWVREVEPTLERYVTEYEYDKDGTRIIRRR